MADPPGARIESRHGETTGAIRGGPSAGHIASNHELLALAQGSFQQRIGPLLIELIERPRVAHPEAVRKRADQMHGLLEAVFDLESAARPAE